MAQMLLGDIPRHYADMFGRDRICLKHEASALSWGELDRASTRRAWAMKAHGVQQDDIVAVAAPNSNAIYEFTFAAWKIGATPSVLSPRLPPHELKAILELMRPKALYAADPSIVTNFGAIALQRGFEDGVDDPLETKMSKHWKAVTSGGSTGRPKVIVDRMPSVWDPDIEYLGMKRGGVAHNPGPTYHAGPFALNHVILARGSTLVGAPKFDPEDTLRIIAENQVDWMYLVPTMMNRIWRLPEATRNKYDISSLKTLWHMAAPCPAWLKQAWIDWLGAETIWEMYGGAERQGVTVLNGAEWLTHRGSVGRPMESEVRILDEDGALLPAGEVGEVFLRPKAGQGTTYHYIGADIKESGDGFESIGDFGWLDEDGYLYIADRRTDMILCGGANVYPAEVEAALLEHPSVQSAVAIGMPDDDMGATVHAIVQPNPDWKGDGSENALKAFLAARILPYKIPRSFEFVSHALRDDAGKVRRSQLREERIAQLGKENRA